MSDRNKMFCCEIVSNYMMFVLCFDCWYHFQTVNPIIQSSNAKIEFAENNKRVKLLQAQ